MTVLQAKHKGKAAAKRIAQLQRKGITEKSRLNEILWQYSQKVPFELRNDFYAGFRANFKDNPGKIKPKLGKWIPAKKVRFLGRGVVQIMK